MMRDTSRMSAISCACDSRVAADDLQARSDAGRLDALVAQQRRPSEDGVERRAQLVRQRGEELVLEPVGALRVGACALRSGRG